MTTTEKVHRLSGRRELEELVQTCISIENRRFSPFLLDITEALRIIRRYSNQLRTLDDHLLDMRAITSVARVVGLQSANLRFQSSALFVDPAMVKQKLDSLSREQLAEFLLLSWHPIVELEQLTLASTKEAKEFWDKMLSFFERRKRLHLGPFDNPGIANLGELARTRIVEEKAYTRKMQDLWKELKDRADEDRKVDYWNFITGTDFAATITRAQLVSFLVSYGYANLQRKGTSMLLVPKARPELRQEGSALSFPIPITKEALIRAK
ncbi:MAG TPA: hypothetical protein VGS11_01135 [Candidatus Bathyarchaeia archaeon]|nr:hypothetical protein [Candidatus Bathyarchaeia archaeon]